MTSSSVQKLYGSYTFTFTTDRMISNCDVLVFFVSAFPGNKILLNSTILKGALTWYEKVTWKSAHAWNLIILCVLIFWSMTFIFMVHLSFDAIPMLIYDVTSCMISLQYLRVPSYNHF